jgi:hypothetical protein
LNLNRDDFRRLARIRRREAKTLLDRGQFAGAYYLLGYAIECALKACICSKTRRFDFPDKDRANKVHTHSLESLIQYAELQPDLKSSMSANPALALNWALVKDWSAEDRYEHRFSEQDVRDFYSACTSRKNGLLPWIIARW